MWKVLESKVWLFLHLISETYKYSSVSSENAPHRIVPTFIRKYMKHGKKFSDAHEERVTVSESIFTKVGRGRLVVKGFLYRIS